MSNFLKIVDKNPQYLIGLYITFCKVSSVRSTYFSGVSVVMLTIFLLPIHTT